MELVVVNMLRPSAWPHLRRRVEDVESWEDSLFKSKVANLMNATFYVLFRRRGMRHTVRFWDLIYYLVSFRSKMILLKIHGFLDVEILRADISVREILRQFLWLVPRASRKDFPWPNFFRWVIFAKTSKKHWKTVIRLISFYPLSFFDFVVFWFIGRRRSANPIDSWPVVSNIFLLFIPIYLEKFFF